MTTNHELVIPPLAEGATQSREILRVWLVDQSLECSVRVTEFDNATPGGLVLADVAKQIANALYEEHGFSVEGSLDSIRYMFNAEMDNPTDETSGNDF
jgi:hypothetical protein